MKQQISTDPKISNKPSTFLLRDGYFGILIVCFTLVILVVFSYSPLIAVVLSMALLFAIFCLNKSQFFMLAIFAVMPFPITIFGNETSFNVSPVDCIAFLFIIILPMYIISGSRFTLGVVTIPLVAYLSFQTISGIVKWEGASTLYTLVRVYVMTFISIGVFSTAGMNLKLAKNCLYSYVVGINVLTLVSLFSFLKGGFHASEFALGINKNSLGPIFGCGVAITIGSLIYGVRDVRTRGWLIASLIGSTTGLILSLSRGGWIASGLGILFLLAITRKFRTFFVLIAVLIPTILVVWSRLPSEATEYASDISISSYNIRARQESISDCIKLYSSNPLFGAGIGIRKYLEPHNVLVLTLAETGIVGLVSFIVLMGSGFYSFYRAAKLSKGNPEALEIVMIGATLLFISLAAGMMDVYWRRGVGFMGWACVGMSIYISSSMRKKAYPTAIGLNNKEVNVLD